MAEWTHEAQDYVDGYLAQVAALARHRRDDADAFVTQLRDRITRETEASGGALIALDQLRKTLAGIGTPEQAAGIETAQPAARPSAPQFQGAPVPPPMAPPSPSASMPVWIIVVVLVAVGVVVLVFFGSIVAAIAIPNVLRARISANESAAIRSLRTLAAAQTQHHAATGAYATDIAELHDPSAIQNQFIDATLAAGAKSGYTFQVTSEDPETSWEATATPLAPAKSGIRTFSIDESGIILSNGVPI
ncbi:MAG TPA: hypothetical protein HPP77_00520 [Candidatus Hydrogenedentes bacterium]|nr:hypothetical protein [Candidatus Hydrogenedentota bacterium]